MTTLVQNARRIAFQGEPGAYANLAAREAAPQAGAIPKPSFEDTIEAVRAGECDLCIIPVENSLMGRIADIHHLLPDSGLAIVAEHFLPIHHQLLAVKDAELDGIRSVYSQLPALAQCRKFIRAHGLAVHHWYDTAGSARHVAELKDQSVAAIASGLAAEIYGLEIVQSDIEDEHHNMTRFLIMAAAPDPAPPGDRMLTSFVFQVKNVPSALYKALGGFATNGVNLTKLESYQLGGSFNATQFYADIEGHPGMPGVKLALEELAFYTSKLTMLGSYPAHPFRENSP